MTDDAHITPLLPVYVLGGLDEDEVMVVAEHVQSCISCRAELQAWQKIADDLVLLVPDIAPPSDLHDRLIQRLPKTRPVLTAQKQSWPSRPQIRQPWLSVWGVASLVLIFLLIATNLVLWQRLNRLERTLNPERMQAIPLTGTEAAPNASGFILVSADGRNGALVIDGLEPLDEEEQQYQLWLLRDGEPTSGAVLSVDEDGYGGTRVSAPELLFVYSAAHITVEPTGGSPSPTGVEVLEGSLFNP